MASGRDVRDMLGLPAGGDVPKSALQKRPKPAAPVKRIQGVAREVAALYGERPPPVAVYEEKKTYRAKRQSTGPAKKWVRQPFTNQARSDGLVLRHWRRKRTNAPAVRDGEDVAMEDSGAGDDYIEDCGDFLKYNITVDLPTFTDEEYDAHLRSDDWSREETEYLFEVVKDYSYRWAVIWDRYDYQPANKSHLTQDTANGNDTSQALAALPFAQPKTRTVEDLKARFYDISAKLMKLRIPEMQMDADQYALYETLSKFDPNLERNRKNLAIALMNRNMDEVKEEEFLLTELQRINMAANRLDAEREELRARLEAPVSNNQNIQGGLASFTSSQALQTLFTQLFQQDRSKKRASGGTSGPARLSLNASDLVQTPSSASHPHLSASARRQSTATQPPAQTPIRTLPPHQEHRFNVSTHDRLTSGVTFGSDKLLKMRQAKSNVQTQKIAAALAELGIPDVLAIPTASVGEQFERLIAEVGKLIDLRKVREKEEGEIRVLEAMKARRGEQGQQSQNQSQSQAQASQSEASKDGTTAAKPKLEVQDSQGGESAGGETQEGDADGDADADGSADVDAEGDEDDEDAEGEEESRQPSERGSSRAVSQGAAAGHKRSASVFSQASRESNKRARK